MQGIYYIICKKNNKVYIGSSINIEKRINRHKRELKNNIHKNSHLQKSVIKYGLDNFEFGLLEGCNNNLLERENYYINYFNSLNSKYGYNKVTAKRNDNLSCNKEYLNNLSFIKKGKYPSNYDLCKAKQKRAILEFENNIFIREYESCKEAGKILEINYKLINNVVRGVVKNVRKYPNKIWKYKQGNVRKILKTNKINWRKNVFKKVYQYDLNNNLLNIFNSIDDAVNILNISRNTIINTCNGKIKKCNKLKCIFKYEYN